MSYDPEAIYQDADVEMAEYASEARRLDVLRKRGLCLHQESVRLGSDGKAHYPEAEGLTGDQRRCMDGCLMVFDNADHWENAMAYPEENQRDGDA